jgi:hypothetical protein
MDQSLTGTVHGNSIVFDVASGLPEGQRVEVLIRSVTSTSDCSNQDDGKPSWWTDEDDRILEEIYQSRKYSTRREIEE